MAIAAVLLDDAALCAQTDPALWFQDKGRQPREAKAICRRCPLLEDCRAHAVADPKLRGVWGATTFQEREAMRRRPKRRGPGRSSARTRTARDARLRELHAAGLSDVAIAAKLGVARPTVSLDRARLGLPANYPRPRRRG